MKILQLSYRVPFPPNDGGAICIHNTTKGLDAIGLKVDLLAINTLKHKQPLGVMKAFCTEYYVDVDTNVKPWPALMNLLFSVQSYNISRFINKDFEAKLIYLLQTNTYDVIHCEGAFTAYYIDIIRKYTSAPAIVRTHNVEWLIWYRLARNTKNLLKKVYLFILVKRLKAFETEYYNKFDAIACIANEDAALLTKMGIAKPKYTIPASIDTDFPHAAEVQNTNDFHIISSMDWQPNVEAVDWFLENIWPKAYALNNDIRLHVAGKNTPKRLMEANIPGITFYGTVSSAADFMLSHGTMLVPLLSGGGMRVKIIEAMALGKCIVASSIGAEGISATNNDNILIANTIDEWCERILAIAHKKTLTLPIAQAAQSYAKAHYGIKVVAEQYHKLYKSLQN